MSGKTILWVSVIVLLIGVGLLTLVPTREDMGGGGLHWVVPVAYFTMIIGAVGMVFGWFRKQ